MSDRNWFYYLRTSAGGALALSFVLIAVTAYSNTLLESKWGIRLQFDSHRGKISPDIPDGLLKRVEDGKLSISEVKEYICPDPSNTELCETDAYLAKVTPNYPFQMYKLFEKRFYPETGYVTRF